MKSSPDRVESWSIGDTAAKFGLPTHVLRHWDVADPDRRMAEMQRSREMTMHAFDCNQHDIARCPQFAGFVSDLVT